MRDQRTMPQGNLPAGWDADDPGTWRFTGDALARLPGQDGPIVVRREVVTGAHEFGHAADPDLLLGMLPRRAAAWWAVVLGPIHRARLAAIGYRAASGTALLGERPGWERLEGDPALDDPTFADILAARAAVARAFLAAIHDGEDDEG